MNLVICLKEKKGCKWVAKNIKWRCWMNDAKIGKKVREMCRKTCNNCGSSLFDLGEACASPSQCKSGSCTFDICTNENNLLLNLGDKCFSNSSCKSNYCYQYKCSIFPQDLGSWCKLNSHCKSGFCKKNVCSDASALLSLGETCSYHIECESLYCYQNTCSVDQKEVGDKCYSDSECKSGYCKNNYCSVATLLSTGVQCTGNFQCQTDYCKNNVCSDPDDSSYLLRIGQLCYTHDQCMSGVCKYNVCYGSESCKDLDISYASEFSDKTIILVFVGSAFQSTAKLEQESRKVLSNIRSYDFFDHSNNDLYRAFFVDDISYGDLCHYNCQGVSQLLCCNMVKVKELSKKCFASSPLVQTIVIHDNPKYGASGFREENIAVISTFFDAYKFAMHELGHSLFEFGDEYIKGPSTPENSPNCDVKGCPKWADLEEKFGVSLCESKACNDGDYYVADGSFMRIMYSTKVNHALLRFSCCSYLALTKTTPGYCDVYDGVGLGLLKYCQNDYQGYGGPGAYIENGIGINDNNPNPSAKYMYVEKPRRVKLLLSSESYIYTTMVNELPPGMYRKINVVGDFGTLEDAKLSGEKSISQITIITNNDIVRDLYFKGFTSMSAPPKMGLGNKIQEGTSVIYRSHNADHHEVIFDEYYGKITAVKMTSIKFK